MPNICQNCGKIIEPDPNWPNWKKKFCKECFCHRISFKSLPWSIWGNKKVPYPQRIIKSDNKKVRKRKKKEATKRKKLAKERKEVLEKIAKSTRKKDHKEIKTD